MKHLFDRLNFIIEETERLDKSSPAPDGEPNPLLQPLFKEATAIVRQLDPLVRERYRDEPEKPAQWVSIQDDYSDILEEDDAERAKREAEEVKG